MATKTALLSPAEAPGLGSTEKRRSACHQGPANNAPGVGGTRALQGLLLKATDPLSATTQTSTTPPSRSRSVFPPVNTSSEVSVSHHPSAAYKMQFQGQHHPVLCTVRQELPGGEGNVPAFSYFAAAQKQEKSHFARGEQGACLLPASAQHTPGWCNRLRRSALPESITLTSTYKINPSCIICIYSPAYRSMSHVWDLLM